MRVEDDVALALKAGAAVVANLLDRRGIKQALWEIDDDVRAELTETVGRLALAAVAPAIEAAALERAAVVAEGISYHGRYRTWPWWANPDGSQGNREDGSDVVRHADKIAAIIRALKETT